MNTQKTITIPCPNHPSEYVQRVALDIDAEKQFFCLECIIEMNGEPNRPVNLKNLNEFIEIAASFYSKNKKDIYLSSTPPSEYFELISRQGKVIEHLENHIEDEKKKVENFFKNLTQEFLNAINEKKNEYINLLDEQLLNLRYWYIFFEKQVKKAHPSEEDIHLLFPTKEDLFAKLQKINNSTQLTAFVRNIKEDLNEKKPDDERAGRNNILSKLFEDLKQLESTLPSFGNLKIDFSPITESMKNYLEEGLNKILVLEDYIIDVQKRGFPTSEILSEQDFKTIKKWIPNEFKFYPKLIFRATRDGTSPKAFHKYCDEKGPTITVIKCQLKNKKEVHVVGGFLDKSWNEDLNDYIQSTKAFLFSITSNLKCSVKSAAQAAWSGLDYGPVFGAEHDLVVQNFQKGSYSIPGTYSGAEKLFRGPNTEESSEEEEGGEPEYIEVYFKILEMEVYTVC